MIIFNEQMCFLILNEKSPTTHDEVQRHITLVPLNAVFPQAQSWNFI